MKLRFTIIIIFLAVIHEGYSQKNITTDYYTRIKKDDVSNLWFNDVNPIENDSLQAGLPEPLSFIGDHYQRFYIHYTSIIKSAKNPYQYVVTGKTKVKENICSFSGTITIIKTSLFRKQTSDRYKQGSLECNIFFNEDSTQNSTGFFKGKLTSKFYIDDNNHIQYDDLLFGADGYFNNQCITTWTGYHSRKTRQFNWGDYRIPNSKALDIGDGEFVADKKYALYGWHNYIIASGNDPEKATAKKAQQAERLHWWE